MICRESWVVGWREKDCYFKKMNLFKVWNVLVVDFCFIFFLVLILLVNEILIEDVKGKGNLRNLGDF